MTTATCPHGCTLTIITPLARAETFLECAHGVLIVNAKGSRFEPRRPRLTLVPKPEPNR